MRAAKEMKATPSRRRTMSTEHRVVVIFPTLTGVESLYCFMSDHHWIHKLASINFHGVLVGWPDPLLLLCSLLSFGDYPPRPLPKMWQGHAGKKT